MRWDFQEITALLFVMGAVAFLGRRYWSMVTRKSTGGCASCSSCAANARGHATVVPQIVTLDPTFARTARH
jgi:hypothetical protein